LILLPQQRRGAREPTSHKEKGESKRERDRHKESTRFSFGVVPCCGEGELHSLKSDIVDTVPLDSSPLRSLLT
jgi:hypothetical protein